MMKKKRASPPATKDDLKIIQTEIHTIRMELQEKATKDDLHSALKKYATKDDLHSALKKYATKDDLQILRRELKDEILDGVRVLNENLFHDFQGAFKDRTEQLRDRIGNHEDRLQRLESRAVAA